MARFRSRPREIEAEQFVDGVETGGYKIPKGVCYCSDGDDPEKLNHRFHVHTMHGNQVVVLEKSDWVVPEPDGVHYYPIKPDVMTKNYDQLYGAQEPTIECDLAGAMLVQGNMDWIRAQVLATVVPEGAYGVNILIRRIANPGGTFPEIVVDYSHELLLAIARAYNRVGVDPDAPIFPVMGRDHLAQAVVTFWVERAVAAGVPEGKVERARRRLQEIIAFQSDHPERVKVPD